MIEEVVLSSTTLDDTLRLVWQETQHTEGETFEYEINYYFDLETIYLIQIFPTIRQKYLSLELIFIKV